MCQTYLINEDMCEVSGSDSQWVQYTCTDTGTDDDPVPWGQVQVLAITAVTTDTVRDALHVK